MTTITDTASLPMHRRGGASFEETFDARAGDVLAAMDAAEHDLVAREPRVGIDVRSAGYARSGVLIQIQDPFTGHAAVPAICRVTIGSSVPRTRRGLHMSRIGDALARSVLPSYSGVADYACQLARAIARCQYGGPTVVAVSARVPYLEALAPEGRSTPKISLEHLHLIARVRVEGDPRIAAQTNAGLRFSHIVACPCVQQTFRHARAAAPATAVTPADEGPGFTHSQRCATTVTARRLVGPLPVSKVLSELDRVVVRTMNTLPRGAELAMVCRAHRAPQFIEDAVRESLWAVHRALDGASFAELRARSRSAESIHEFDLSASAVLTPEDIRRSAAVI